jgi:hypothetical protein
VIHCVPNPQFPQLGELETSHWRTYTELQICRTPSFCSQDGSERHRPAARCPPYRKSALKDASRHRTGTDRLSSIGDWCASWARHPMDCGFRIRAVLDQGLGASIATTPAILLAIS